MTENEDDWFYDSISRYKNLSMFELEYPAYNLDQISNDSICVSCSDMNQHQLLEFILPQKLISQASNAQGGRLTSDTDLKIRCGTFTPARIEHMRAYKNDRTVVASHQKMCGLTFYKLPVDDSDKIENSYTIRCELESPFLAVNESEIVLTKTSSRPIYIINKTTGHMMSKVLYSQEGVKEEVVSPMYVDSRVVGLCNHSSGTLRLYDSRDYKVFETNMVFGKKNSYWCFASFYESSSSADNNSVAIVSNKGDLKMYDPRKWNIPYVDTRLEVEPTNSSSVQVRFKPLDKCSVSLSGFNANVYVYKVEPQPQMVFVHDGHQHVDGFTPDTVTSSHLWFPNIVNLIISSACNGTVQSWQFEDSSTVPCNNY